MKINGEIIVIDDDEDDREILNDLLSDILISNNYPNKLVLLNTAFEAVEYLKSIDEQPFLVISDINMPKMTGFELREFIFKDSKINELCIPFIFLTTSEGSTADVARAYQMSVQGFFKKYSDLSEFRKTLETVINYWRKCQTPNI